MPSCQHPFHDDRDVPRGTYALRAWVIPSLLARLEGDTWDGGIGDIGELLPAGVCASCARRVWRETVDLFAGVLWRIGSVDVAVAWLRASEAEL